MVHGMAPGSVIVDMAAGQGGNVELSQPDEDVVVNGVIIDGPTNLPSTVPVHASMTYAKNLTAFLMNLYNGKERVLKIDTEDQIVRESLIARSGEVTNVRLRQALGLADPVQEPPPTAPVTTAEPAAAVPGAAVPGKEA
jgi:NAD(P) transhydrogenase subunit alpha